MVECIRRVNIYFVNINEGNNNNMNLTSMGTIGFRIFIVNVDMIQCIKCVENSWLSPAYNLWDIYNRDWIGSNLEMINYIWHNGKEIIRR